MPSNESHRPRGGEAMALIECDHAVVLIQGESAVVLIQRQNSVVLAPSFSGVVFRVASPGHARAHQCAARTQKCRT